MVVSTNRANGLSGELAPMALAWRCSEWDMLALWLCELNGPGGTCKTAIGEHCLARSLVACGPTLAQAWSVGSWVGCGPSVSSCVWSGRSVDPGR